MPRVDAGFAGRVYELVARIPWGRVMTYGQIAGACGHAYAAWEVGQIAHQGPTELPWQRVVNKKGGMASAYVPGGPQAQRALLEGEGIVFNADGAIQNLGEVLWHPQQQHLL